MTLRSDDRRNQGAEDLSERVEQRVNPMGSARLSGGALISGALLLIVGGALEPGVEEVTLDAFANVMTGTSGGWYLSHVLMILAFPIWMVGFVSLGRALIARGERIYSVASVVALGLVTVFATLGLMLEGFVDPILARDYLAASGGARDLAAAILEYNIVLDMNVDNVTTVALIVGLGLTGASLLRARLGARWFAWAGLVLAGYGGLGFVLGLGIFGPFALLNPLLGPYVAVAVIWVIGLGIVLYQQTIERGRRVDRATKAMG